MGMSASQARLLSITARLTNNEFRSQTITNSKLRLAEKSSEASQEYMDALNTQQLMFGVYDDNGNYTKQDLTPALIYDYAPLKNQYALINTAGKMLVSNQDAENFENTNSLTEFLDCYGLMEGVSYKTRVETNNENYETEMKDYNDKLDKYNKYQAYLAELEKYEKDFAAWLKRNNYKDLAAYEDALEEAKNRPDLYSTFTSVVGTSDNPLSCYAAAKNGGAGCFLHLLDYLINYDFDVCSTRRAQDLTTTTGVQFNTGASTSGATLDGMTEEQRKVFGEISKNLSNVKCDGHDNDNYETNPTEMYNLLESKKQNGETITDFDKLKSDYLDNGDGTYSVKTLEQKAIDMYYIIKNRTTFLDDQRNTLITTDMMNELLDNFTDGDMKKIDLEAPPRKPDEVDYAEYPTNIPSMTIVTYKDNDVITVNDKDKAQWYVNLWYYMNGSETANKVKQKEITDAETNVTSNVFVVEAADKSGKGGTYEVFEDLSLYKSSDWLQFALEHGMVTMYQAQYNNPALDSGKVSELTSEGVTWTSIIYTNASDITQQDDETAIAIAEVKYKNAVTEIENKDKKYDQDLKKLDTEHSALQTEYDSIKEVIGKNVERSFKAFS